MIIQEKYQGREIGIVEQGSSHQPRTMEAQSIYHRRGHSSLFYQLGIIKQTVTKRPSSTVSTSMHDWLTRTEPLSWLLGILVVKSTKGTIHSSFHLDSAADSQMLVIITTFELTGLRLLGLFSPLLNVISVSSCYWLSQSLCQYASRYRWRMSRVGANVLSWGR